MGRFVLDASALLTAVFDEPGAGRIEEALKRGASISTVNVAEVAGFLRRDGWTAGEVADVVTELGIETVPLDAETALLAGAYERKTRRLGLTMGAWACLATARRLDLPALTADPRWTGLKLRGVTVEVVGE